MRFGSSQPRLAAPWDAILIPPDTPLQTAHSFLIVLFAVALTIQITPQFANTEIRLALSEIVLPIILVFAWLVAARQDRASFIASLYTNWQILLALGAMTLVLVGALLIGWAGAGELIRWAAFNKMAGWFVLLGYFLAGWAMVFLACGQAAELFVKTLIAAAVASSLATLCIRLLSRIGWDAAVRLDSIRPSGLMENPNAFGFFLVSASALAIVLLRPERWLLRGLKIAAVGLILATLVLTGSRGAWIAVAPLPFVLIWVRSSALSELVAAALLAIAVLSGLANVGTTKSAVTGAEPPPGGHYWISRKGFHGGESSLDVRMNMLSEAFGLWKSKPVFGTGLGIYYHVSSKKPDASPAHLTLHSTPLWILTEMGLIGLAVFGASFIFFCFRIYPGRDSGPGPGHDPPARIRAAILAVLACFAVMSISMEVMYQRHLWVLLGIGLALACRPKAEARDDLA